jgi:Tfp pilus assembly protein PilZ
MRKRGAVRVVPRNPVTVAIGEGERPPVYGIVANISEAGACVWTDARLEQGRNVHLLLSFTRGSRPVEADGVVVWGGPVAEPDAKTLRYGLRWTDTLPVDQERLRRLIAES